MSPSKLSDKEFKLIKERRLNFLKSCYNEFQKVLSTRVNETTRCCEDVWCEEDWFDAIIRYHFENVDPLHHELLDPSHLIDRHKVASCLLYHIMDSCPLCYMNEALNGDVTQK